MVGREFEPAAPFHVVAILEHDGSRCLGGGLLAHLEGLGTDVANSLANLSARGVVLRGRQNVCLVTQTMVGLHRYELVSQFL